MDFCQCCVFLWNVHQKQTNKIVLFLKDSEFPIMLEFLLEGDELTGFWF